MQQNNREFILVDKKDEAENITSLFFKPSDNLGYEFKSGQYVNARPLSVSGHGKSYTISSPSYEKLICLTVKRKGSVSSALIDFPIKQKLSLDGPYGFFYPEEDCGELVMIAGGIGVTPFYSIIRDRLNSKNKTKITLFYSNKRLKDVAFFEEFNELANNNPQFNIVYVLTQADAKCPLVYEYSRIDGKMLKKHLVSLDKKKYFICGSIGFVNDMWKLLKKEKVPEESIFTESFF